MARMGATNQQAFTIVEVMLFLGLSALLAVGLLTGWSTMLNTQRYKDSNKTLQSFIQQQYNLVYNVENAREKEFICNSGGVTQDATGTNRGQTDCVMMGRYIHIDKGLNVRVYAIVGYEPANIASLDIDNDLESIQAHEPARVDDSLRLSESELLIPWQATVVDNSGEPQSAVIAIVRSPSTGVVHTYRQLTSVDELPPLDESDETLIVPSKEQEDLVLCLDPGAPLSGVLMGVVVEGRASAQSAVRTTTDSEDAC